MPVSVSNAAQILRTSQTATPSAKDAQCRLVDVFGKLLMKLATQACRQCCLHNQDREEVVAETYQQILNPDITRFALSRGNPAQYFKGLVQNAARKIMTQRDKRRRKGITNADAMGEDTPMPVGLAGNGGEEVRPCRGRYRTPPPALSPAEYAEQRDIVKFILQQAPPHLRRAMELCYWADRTLQSIAEELGVSRFALARELNAFFGKMNMHLEKG